MRTRQLVLWTALAGSLAAQEGQPGYRWVGLQAGSLSPDTQTNLKAAPFFGLQGGLLFDEKRYGLSFQALVASPKSDLAPGKSLSQSEFSATLLTGLSGDAASRFWPYIGLGLGAASIPRIESTTGLEKTHKGGTAHMALGFQHRPGLGLVWGLEGRYSFTFANGDLKEARAGLMVGYAWGARRAAAPRPEPAPAMPEAAPVKPPPPAPLPVVSTVPAPTQATPVEKLAPAPQPPIARPLAPPPPPAPTPAHTPAPAPKPVPAPAPVPPPPPVVVAAPPSPRPTPPAPSSPKLSSSEVTRRLDALRLGDMARALELGKAHIGSLPSQRWTIRLEIANLPSTLKNAVAAFPGQEPDLFIAPIKLKGGKTAYQLFLGDYATKSDAERAAKAVPAFFLEGGQRPRPYQINAIPAQ